MIKKKTVLGLMLAGIMAVSMVGCKGNSNTGFDTTSNITVVSRDSASGTRTAFHELLKITVKENDKEVDKLVTGSLEFDSTDKVITAVEGDKNAIGYVSMGSLSDRIKGVKIDGIEPTAENVKNGSYKVSRPFLMLTKSELSDVVKDFVEYTQSKQGQDIVLEKNYIAANSNATEYTAKNMTGTIKISGSTSVEPVMQKLIEGYKELNPNVTFETQYQGSSQGIKDAISGNSDIGLSSRELKDTEKESIQSNTLALDGIAIIVNKQNTIDTLTSQNVTDIYTGAVTKWDMTK